MAKPDEPSEGSTLVREGVPAAEASTLISGTAQALATSAETFVRDAATSKADTFVHDPPPGAVGPTVSGSAPVQLGSTDSPVTSEAKGRYQLRREFGRGGQAVVWLAHDEHIGRELAMKMLAPGAGSSLGSRSKGSATVRFLREARVTGQLEHPSIVPVYELGEREDGSLYYTQKLVRGRTLRAALDGCKGLPDRLALLSHFADVCNAVAYAHGRGVVHRDLKPENVMVGEFGETVVLDWGLAKVTGHADPSDTLHGTPVVEAPADATRAGAILGTPLYMSPEQAMGKLELVDERSDVWALGAVLYEILTGRPPFLGQNPTQVLFKVANAPLEPVRKHCVDAPPELASVAERALSRDRAQRYATARALAGEVAAWQSGARVLAYNYTTWELAKKLARRNPLASAIAASALLVLVISAIAIFLAHRQAVSYLADSLLSRARSAEREQRWAMAATWRAAARTHEDRSEARWGQALAEQLSIKPWRRLAGHDGEAWAVAYLPDGRLASAGEEGKLRIWDPESGKLVRELVGHQGRVSALAASQKSGLLASGGEDETVRLWDAASGKLLRTLPASGEVWATDFSPDGALVAAGDMDGNLTLFEVATGAVRHRFRGTGEEIAAVGFSRDGKLVAAGETNGSIHVWSTSTFERTRKVTFGGHELWSLSFTADPNVLVVGGDHGLLRMMPLNINRRRVLVGHQRIVSATVVSPDGTIIATASRDGSIRLWDAETSVALARLDSHERAVNALAFSADGRSLAAAYQSHVLRVWALPAQPALRPLSAHTADVRAIAFNSTGTRFASAAEDSRLRLWDATTMRPLLDFPLQGGWVRSVEFSPDDKVLAAGSNDGNLRLYDAATGGLLRVLTGHDEYISTLHYQPGTGLLASASGDGTVRFWEPSTGKKVREVFIEDSGKLHSFDFSPDGKLFASGGSDRLVRIFESATGQLQRSMPGHDETIRAIAWSPNGRVIASAGHDRTVRLWNAKSGKLLHVLARHEGQVRALAFSRDGAVLASACTDRELRLWEVGTGAALALLPWHEAGVLAVAWSRDGRLLASGSGDGVIDVLRFDQGREQERDAQSPEDSLQRLLRQQWLKLSRLELEADLPEATK